jgi:hypothetical protein
VQKSETYCSYHKSNFHSTGDCRARKEKSRLKKEFNKKQAFTIKEAGAKDPNREDQVFCPITTFEGESEF